MGHYHWKESWWLDVHDATGLGDSSWSRGVAANVPLCRVRFFRHAEVTYRWLSSKNVGRKKYAYKNSISCQLWICPQTSFHDTRIPCREASVNYLHWSVLNTVRVELTCLRTEVKVKIYDSSRTNVLKILTKQYYFKCPWINFSALPPWSTVLAYSKYEPWCSTRIAKVFPSIFCCDVLPLSRSRSFRVQE